MKKVLCLLFCGLLLCGYVFAQEKKYKIEIEARDKVCEKNEDCATVFTTCEQRNECGEEDAVNLKFLEKYQKLFTEVCKDYKTDPNVISDCRKMPQIILCENKKCVQNPKYKSFGEYIQQEYWGN